MPHPDRVNGIITGYNIIDELSRANEHTAWRFNETITYYVVNGLLPFTEYKFAVSAFTKIGAGPSSFPVDVLTDEEGNLGYNFFVYLYFHSFYAILFYYEELLSNYSLNNQFKYFKFFLSAIVAPCKFYCYTQIKQQCHCDMAARPNRAQAWHYSLLSPVW